jgi:hypothetical protein
MPHDFFFCKLSNFSRFHVPNIDIEIFVNAKNGC